ncbi:MAG: arylsulfatase [Hyphomonadaceae bacterium]
MLQHRDRAGGNPGRGVWRSGLRSYLRSCLRSCVSALIVVAALAAPGARAQTPDAGAQSDEPTRRPNIVLMLVDDAALMDFGAYGGEANTPNIDRLAARGALFTSYHTSPLCSPSRAMLLTGVDNHRTGVATIEEVLPPSQRGKPGYSLTLEPGVLTLADRLRSAGYRTLMSGKWHLGRGDGDLPNHHGFDRSLALDASGADNWEQKAYMPYYKEAPWFEDGEPTTLPETFYSSDLLVDRMISYIDEKPPGDDPWFAYVAFQAVHIPVQAPKAYSDRYKGRFDEGWEAVREQRWRRARDIGLFPEDARIRDLPPETRRWADLSEDDRRIYARSMEVYSGMLEAMDAAIGRLIAHVEERGESDNTIFVIASDNGPEHSDPVHQNGMNIWMALHGYHWNLDRLGERGSLAFIGPEWAASISSPGDLYKFFAAEGGIHVPLIMAGPEIRSGERVAAASFVIDVAPTLLEMAGVSPEARADAVSIDGRSLLPVLKGDAGAVRSDEEFVGIEVSGNSALFRGGHKIVRIMPPVGDGAWRLYDMTSDPGETTDLSKTQPDLFASMLADYARYEQRMGVLPMPEGYTVTRQLLRNSLLKQAGYMWPWMVAALLLVAALIVLVARWMLGRRRRH